jgi:HEAT repeat protein
MRKTSLVVVGAFTVGLVLSACEGDPHDPRTWARKVKNVRDQKEALDQLAKMSVDRAQQAIPELIALYKETKKPEHLEALSRFHNDQTKPLFIEALDFTEDDFDRAVIAAGALGEMKSVDAVAPLIKAVEHQLPIKSRANTVRLAALRALVKIGDKRAVPPLMKILTTSADEQDFMLNQKAALGLAELRDPQSIPALIKGLFMTGRGTQIFQECRLALVRIGDPAVDPLIELLNEKNAEITEMARKLDFDTTSPGIVPFKAAYLLGDLRAARAVPALAARLKVPAKSGEHKAILIGLGFIGNPQAVKVLLTVLKDKKAKATDRQAAEDGIYLSGDKRAVPILLDTAKNGYVVVDGYKASDLRANAAIDLARIAGKETYDAFAALVEQETDSGAKGIFDEALLRMEVAKECDKDIKCYEKILTTDELWPRAEKAAFAIGFSGDAEKGIPILLSALKPVASLPQLFYPVHQAILQSLIKLADASCKICEEKLIKQIERDEVAVRLPGARDLLGETRVTLAVIQSKKKAN